MATVQHTTSAGRAATGAPPVKKLFVELVTQIWRNVWPDLRRHWKKRLLQAGVGMPTLLMAWLFVDIDVRFNEPATVARRAELLGGLGLTGYFVYTVSTPPMMILADKAALRHGVDPMLFRALVGQESAWNPNVVSPKGAVGLTQLMPATAAEECGLRGEALYDAERNLDCGAAYLAKQLRRFNAVELALAAYNAGPEKVARLGRVPKIAETENYVARILTNWSSGETGT